jgi:hypothetical protein
MDALAVDLALGLLPRAVEQHAQYVVFADRRRRLLEDRDRHDGSGSLAFWVPATRRTREMSDTMSTV